MIAAFKKFWDFLLGKKTYLIAFATIIYAISAAIIGQMSWHDAWQMIWASIISMTLRHGIGDRNA